MSAAFEWGDVEYCRIAAMDSRISSGYGVFYRGEFIGYVLRHANLLRWAVQRTTDPTTPMAGIKDGLWFSYPTRVEAVGDMLDGLL